jgi:hypothetical protein
MAQEVYLRPDAIIAIQTTQLVFVERQRNKPRKIGSIIHLDDDSS